jgi:integrase
VSEHHSIEAPETTDVGSQTTLTEKSVHRLAKAPVGQRRELYDRLQPGLALRVTDKGAKSWCVYCYVNNRHRRITLGRWPSLKVDEARTRAREVRELAASGLDPKEERNRERARAAAAETASDVQTFQDLAEQYIERKVPNLVSGKEIESVLRRRLIPEWGNSPIDQIRKRHAIRLLDRLVDEGSDSGALSTYRVIKRVFSWGAKRDEIDNDPMSNLEAPVNEQPRQVILDHNTIRVLWSVWTDQGYPFGHLYKFLLLTGQRRGEAAEMTFWELDPIANPTVWFIPSSRTKNRRQHELPLSNEARDILAEVPRGNEGPFIFSTSAGRRPVCGFSKSAAYTHRLAREKAEQWGVDIRDDWVVHDLRRTVRTEMARLGVSEQVAERVLNHTPEPLVQTYNVHTYDREKAQALQMWATELMRIVEGPHDTDPFNPYPPIE